MENFCKCLAVGLLIGGASGCVRMDRPIRPQYAIGTPHLVIRDQAQPVFDVKQVIGRLVGLLSFEALRSRFQ